MRNTRGARLPRAETLKQNTHRRAHTDTRGDAAQLPSTGARQAEQNPAYIKDRNKTTVRCFIPSERGREINLIPGHGDEGETNKLKKKKQLLKGLGFFFLMEKKRETRN